MVSNASHATLDCVGMICPMPLMACRNCIEEEAPESLTVRVDDEAGLENVTRYLSDKGYSYTHTKDNRAWIITAERDPQAVKASAPSAKDCLCPVPSKAEDQRILVFLTADVIGRGDDGFGSRLLTNFLKTLPELGKDLWRIVMVNSAVKAAVEDSPHLEALKALEDQGVSILVCGTCLEFFGLRDKRAVGENTNMIDVVTSMQLASKVINP